MRSARHVLTEYPELVVVATCCGLAITLFDVISLDLLISRWFFDVARARWPGADLPWVRFINDHFVDALTIVAFVAGLACCAVSWLHRKKREWRQVGVFLLLTLAIGPGLLVNGFFKTQWGRPRPDQVVQFSGQQEFRRPSQPGEGGSPESGGAGRSFPSGHAAVGFWTTTAFFLARYLLPGRSLLILGTALAVGGLVAISRIIAGRHFVSDVLWAGIIVFSINWLIAYRVLGLPRRPRSPSS
jgi:lipid A 4'-phosphatase